MTRQRELECRHIVGENPQREAVSDAGVIDQHFRAGPRLELAQSTERRDRIAWGSADEGQRARRVGDGIHVVPVG